MSTRAEIAVRREGSTEVRVLTALVVVLLMGAYLSWTRKDDAAALEKVNINELAADRVDELVWITRTQTVTVSRKQAPGGGDKYTWFDVKSGKTTKGFKGNKASSTVFDAFAPFVAVRTLGTQLDAAQLAETKLEHPDSKLIVRSKGDDKVYQVGARTFGTRDWYVRASGGSEVFVVASRVFQDVDFAEGKFMQRDLETLDKKDVSGVILKAGPKEQRFLQQNRLSPSDAFWTRAETPDAKDEAVGNYLRKLEGLKAIAYVEPSLLGAAVPVLTVTWLEDDKPKETVVIHRGGEPGKEKYYAVSEATVAPVEVAKSVGEQLEQDLSGVLQ